MSDEKKPTAPSANGGATPVACATSTCPALKNSMTADQAQAEMDQFKKEDIPFDYPVDCCYARARVMCDDLEKQGYASEKLWSKGNLAAQKADGTPVTFPDRQGNPQAVTWGYHVAPIVNVVQPDGSTSPRVLDPSLSDKPLTVDEWKARCGVKPGDTQDQTTAPNKDYPFSAPWAGNDVSVASAQNALKDHRSSRDINRAAAKANSK